MGSKWLELTVYVLTAYSCLPFTKGLISFIPITLNGLNCCHVHFAAVTVLTHWTVLSESRHACHSWCFTAQDRSSWLNAHQIQMGTCFIVLCTVNTHRGNNWSHKDLLLQVSELCKPPLIALDDIQAADICIYHHLLQYLEWYSSKTHHCMNLNATVWTNPFDFVVNYVNMCYLTAMSLKIIIIIVVCALEVTCRSIYDLRSQNHACLGLTYQWEK